MHRVDLDNIKRPRTQFRSESRDRGIVNFNLIVGEDGFLKKFAPAYREADSRTFRHLAHGFNRQALDEFSVLSELSELYFPLFNIIRKIYRTKVEFTPD